METRYAGELQWKSGERTYYAFARARPEDDGTVSYVPAMQTFICNAAGPVVEASLERFPHSDAALGRAKDLLQRYFGLDGDA
jgi:hypothetical protein